MGQEEITFGQTIGAARKKKGWSLKELAAKITREDGVQISPQYLNDIEHDRRSPSSDHLVQQFAKALGMSMDWLYYLAGRFPQDVRERKLSESVVKKSMMAFRSGQGTKRRAS